MEEVFEVFLIDKNGNRFSSDNISSHIGLAYLIMEKDGKLKEEFEQSRKQNPLEYLLGDKGCVTVSEIGNYYREVIYDSKLISETQKKWVQYYHDRNYKLKDLAIEKENLESGG